MAGVVDEDLEAELFGGALDADTEPAHPDPDAAQQERGSKQKRGKRDRQAAFDDVVDEGEVSDNPEYQEEANDDADEQGTTFYAHDEAIEEHEGIAKLIKGGKRSKPQEDPEYVRNIVDSFCKQMEIAAEMDMTDHNSGKIAMAKLRMIEQVDTFCSKKHYRQQLIESKVTSGMKAWLCPYHDGTLPHVKVRTAVLRNLKKLELDPTDDEVKSLLKETQVGHYVMFLKMNSDETVENRRLANQLVQKWANPLSSEDMQIRKQRDAQRVQQYKERKKKETQQPTPSIAVLNAGLAPGDPGYRNHATIPRASKLDYVTAPESTAREKQSGGAKNDALAKKLREVNKKAKVTSARAMKPSAEGRGILL